jgi:nucleotide-binding universal stress UspA family protein
MVARGSHTLIIVRGGAQRGNSRRIVRHRPRGQRQPGEAAMKLIVHATDGSPEAAEARAVAVDLAQETEARIVVITVHPVAHPRKGVQLPVREVETGAGARRVAQEAVDAISAAGVASEAVVLIGEPADEIATYAADAHADVIVVGSRGFGTLHGALVGSVSRALMKRSMVPVTIVKTQTDSHA